MKAQVILLVEDDPRNRGLTLRALKKSGLANEVTVVRDGAEALDYLFCTGTHVERDSADVPALILLDLNLPKISGLEVLKRIRTDEKTKLLPVVILTSSDEERDLIEAYQFGANSYVRAPVEFNEFANAVRQLGLYWLILNELTPPN